MAVYKIYLVHDDGELETGEAFHAAGDSEALARLQAPPAEDMRAELWQGGRFVAMAFRHRQPDVVRQLLSP